MARVFRCKIAIPGDQMEAYFQALEEFEKTRSQCGNSLSNVHEILNAS
jgi:hypothetical protein